MGTALVLKIPFNCCVSDVIEEDDYWVQMSLTMYTMFLDIVQPYRLIPNFTFFLTFGVVKKTKFLKLLFKLQGNESFGTSEI